MRTGTKSVLFGVHQFILHPLFVLRAWILLYRKWPRWHEFLAILTHDLGYWGCPSMDGLLGEKHPEVMARWWLNRKTKLSAQVAREVAGHSRFYAKKYNTRISPLFFADKLAVSLYPVWLYKLLGNLSGEIQEYINNSKTGNHSIQVKNGFSQSRWIIEIQAHMALMALFGEGYEQTMKRFKQG